MPFPPRLQVLLFVFLALATAFTTADMIEDLSDHPSPLHMTMELGVVFASGSALACLVLEWRQARREILRLGGGLTVANAEAARWRDEARQALDGLSAAIDRQFEQWRLTSAEREIGLLLLKGFAMKEIADLRGTAERTVRHQTQDIYRKAGLSGRTDFSAYFLEDLLPNAREKPSSI